MPEGRGVWDSITVRLLLTHTSGIPEYTDSLIDLRKDYTEDELVRIFLQLGAFSVRANADNFRAKLQRQLDDLKQTMHTQASENLFRVRLGPYRSRAEANEVAGRIRDVLEFKPVIVGR